jgi:hypothetical protein
MPKTKRTEIPNDYELGLIRDYIQNQKYKTISQEDYDGLIKHYFKHKKKITEFINMINERGVEL